MTPVRATYRLQFRTGMDLPRAAGIVPYLARLGVSHLYASPIFQATPGSTHGYDAIDFGRIDESLGGREGLERLSHALHGHGLGLILDIVPNHMAATALNPWWRDVLRHGRDSAYAGHFDIDWSRPKLLLPILDRPYGKALSDGQLALGATADGLVLAASGQDLPLDPRTWRLVLEGFDGADGGGQPDPDGFPAWQREPANSMALGAHLAAVSRDHDRLHAVHEAQPWRLAYWRAARDNLGHRRFFEISDLVGVRVEDPAVFDDVHGFVLDLIEAGHVDGLRIDHIDGLADPKGYLDRLAGALPRPVPVWIEKILERHEAIPGEWRTAGTSGYDFLAAVNAALTSEAAAGPLSEAYDAFCGEHFDYGAMRDAAKREALGRNLAAELETLVRFALAALADDPSGRDWGPDSIRRAITALLVAMPVYRTYLTADTIPSADRALVGEVAAAARGDPGIDDPAVIEPVVGLLLAEDAGEVATRFRTRFQQVSGALMAKAVEDTLFYRFNRLVSANEVGADPGEMALGADAFHAFAAGPAAGRPLALNATATHDTKRGEDARMRIAAISERAENWSTAVAGFDALLRQGGVTEIDANARWLFHQALLGAWRPDLGDDLAARLTEFMLKAAREAKSHTSWVKANPDYEKRLSAFVGEALACRPFVDTFAEQAPAYIEIGRRKSLAQLALKLTMPGVPDIYQGTERADLSFVDPDNRREVDFAALDRSLGETGEAAEGALGEDKLALLRFGLRLRADHADVFTGGYTPIPLTGAARGFAFAREGNAAVLMVAVDLSGTGTAPEAGRTREATDPEAPVAAFPPPQDERIAGVSLRLFRRSG